MFIHQRFQFCHTPLFLREKTFETKLFVRQSRCYQRRNKSCRSGQALYFDTIAHTFTNYQKTRIRNSRCSGIRNQSNGFSCLYSINNTLHRFMFIKLMVGLHRVFNLKMFQQDSGSTGILRQNQVDLLQDFNSPECHVLQIPDRRRYHI